MIGITLSVSAIGAYRLVEKQTYDDGLELARGRASSSFASMALPQAVAHCLALPNELPVLLDAVPVNLATAAYPQRTLRVPTDWPEQPEAAFTLLEKHVLPGQRIGQLYFAQDKIQVTVVGPVEVAAQPPVPFGVLNFDAYGVADQDAWAPTLPGGNTCQQGRTLSELKALFAQAPRPHRLLYAWFDCDPTQAHGNVGQWYLRDVGTRKAHLPPGRH